MLSTEELLDGLTDPQRQAVCHVDGPLLIIAGAGSGKTRVLTRRVAYLMSLGIPAGAILAITFTNKAAGEMKERVGHLLGKPIRDFGRLEAYQPTICTFHSLCLRVLRHYADRLGFPASFSIYDTADQQKLMKDQLKKLDFSSTNFTPSTVLGTISNAKNKLITAEQFAAGANDFYAKNVAKLYTAYQAALEAANAFDFDDLLMKTVHALRDHKDVLAELQERYAYILIDEYQDTNHAQYVLAHALGMGKRNVAVVGDPDQSIYAWRGADIQNILDFEKDYADATVVRLEQNYRSTKVILQVADALIANNSQRKDKRLWTENDDGQKPEVILAQDEHDEAKQVTQRLKDANEAGVPWSDMAVFYRMNSLSRVMEDALRHANVPYQIARGVEFYNRKEIKDVLAYLKYVANPADEVALTRIINTPTRGIGNQTVNQLTAFGVARGLKLHEALDHAGECEGLSSRAVNAVRNFATLVRRWRELTAAPANAGNGEIFEEKAGTVQRVMEAVVREAGFEQDLRKKGDKEQAELNNVYELISSAAEYDRQNPEGTLIDYLGEVSLVADADHMKGNGGAVTLMTLHAAKGLEFPVVAIIGLEEGILPHGRARGSLSELEEERRLCFVGITRAQQRLILGKANIRTVRGIRERTITSPFLNELPAELLDVTDRTGVPDPADRHDPYGRAFDTARAGLATPFRKGDAVRHPKFGTGTVFDVAGMGTNTRVVVDFQSAGRKTLILEYARLEPA